MTSNNSLYFLGAAVVGIVSAAGVFIAEHFRQERRRHAMAQDLARLDQQLSGMQKELEQLRALQKEKSAQRVKRSKRPSSNAQGTDEYASAPELDSSDMEFYDLSDEDDTTSTVTPLDQQTLKEIDDKLNAPKVASIKVALAQLTDLCMEFPENPELLWRIGKAHHKISTATDDKLVKQENIEKGLAACHLALNLNSNIAEAHKWYAILIGLRSSFQPVKEKISDGFLFKKHIDAALALNPDDATLHHMLGRFSFESAGLKWYERKVATAFFAEPPSATFDEALEHFQEAEKLTKNEWKENKLLIAKCQIALGRYEEAVHSLTKANNMTNDTLDNTIDSEVKTLLQKYNSYS